MNNQYLFNVKSYDGMYDDTIDKTIKDAQTQLLGFKLSERLVDYKLPEGTESLKLKIVYPGLLIGTGNPHASGESDDEIKLGFTLDYTTGLPYIPGSTLKGTIRSVFKRPDERGINESEDHYNARLESYENRKEYLCEIIRDIVGEQIQLDSIPDLEKEIFEGQVNENQISDDKFYQKRDIFFDAFPIKGDSKGKLFAYEFITPHKPFKNPVPLRFLKVLPDVTFEFFFCAQNSRIIPGLTAENKKRLFERIILDFGIGAKTNVGFGQFTEDDLKCVIDTDNKREGTAVKSGNTKNSTGVVNDDNRKNCGKTEEKEFKIENIEENKRNKNEQVARVKNTMIFGIPMDIKKGDIIIAKKQNNGKYYDYVAKKQ